MHPRDYFHSVVKSWWNVVGIVGGVLGIVSGISSIDAPRWLWIGLLVMGLVVVCVTAFLLLEQKFRTSKREGEKSNRTRRPL